MSAITLTELNYDETTPGDGAEIAAYLRTGTEALTSTSGSLNVNVTNTVTVSATDFDIRDLSAAQDNIAISDGTDTLEVNADGSINAVVSATDLDIRDLNSATDSVSILSNFEYAEDAAHTTGNVGAFMLAVRHDADTSLVSDDGDYAPLQVDANGALKVSGSLSVTEQDVYAEDSAHSDGALGGYILSVRQDAYASSTSADGDYQSFKTDVFGRLWTNISANSAMANGAAAVSTTALLVAANAGRRRILVQNLGSKKVYLGASGVSSSNGIMLPAAGSVELEIGPALALHAVAESGTQDVRYLQLA